MYAQRKCTRAPLCPLFTSLFNTQVLHYSVQLPLNSPERIQSWTAVTWVQRVPESVCVAHKLPILFTVKEEQVYVPSGIWDALEGIKWPHGLEEVVALRNLFTLGTSGKRVKGQGFFRAYCNHCKQVGGVCLSLKTKLITALFNAIDVLSVRCFCFQITLQREETSSSARSRVTVNCTCFFCVESSSSDDTSPSLFANVGPAEVSDRDAIVIGRLAAWRSLLAARLFA